MAILFITHKFPPAIGGMQRQSYELINGIRAYSKVYTIIQSPTESKLYFFGRLRSRIKKILRLHPDIRTVHCNDAVVASMCTWLKKYSHLRLTVTFHGLDIVFPWAYFQRVIVPRLRSFDKIFAVSQATRQACIERGFLPQQVIMIPNGVDHNIVDETPHGDPLSSLQDIIGRDIYDKKIIVSIGRAVARKGFSWFARQVVPLLDDDTIYIIVGPRSNPTSIAHRLISMLPGRIRGMVELFFGYPSDSDALTSAMEAHVNRVFHLGSLDWPMLLALMSRASLLAMPNIKVEGDMEGFGLVALEANLRNTYVIASAIEGITTAVKEGINGSLMSTYEPEDWAIEIKSLLSNSKILHMKAEQSRHWVLQNFGWDKMVRAYWHQFELLDSDQYTHPTKAIVRRAS